VLPFRRAIEIKADGIVGAAILDNAVVFPENGNRFDCKVKFTIPEDAKVKKCYIIGLAEGEWTLSDGRKVSVDAESGIAEFDVTGKEIEITRS
jgi:hypothetical protein